MDARPPHASHARYLAWNKNDVVTVSTCHLSQQRHSLAAYAQAPFLAEFALLQTYHGNSCDRFAGIRGTIALHFGSDSKNGRTWQPVVTEASVFPKWFHFESKVTKVMFKHQVGPSLFCQQQTIIVAVCSWAAVGGLSYRVAQADMTHGVVGVVRAGPSSSRNKKAWDAHRVWIGRYSWEQTCCEW